jgi:hypothetical protein
MLPWTRYFNNFKVGLGIRSPQLYILETYHRHTLFYSVLLFFFGYGIPLSLQGTYLHLRDGVGNRTV